MTLEKLIDKITDGCEYNVELKGYAPNDIIEYLESQGYEKGELETNGWQVDFWVSFTKEDHTTLELTGDWFYGNMTLQEI